MNKQKKQKRKKTFTSLEKSTTFASFASIHIPNNGEQICEENDEDSRCGGREHSRNQRREHSQKQRRSLAKTTVSTHKNNGEHSQKQQ